MWRIIANYSCSYKPANILENMLNAHRHDDGRFFYIILLNLDCDSQTSPQIVIFRCYNPGDFNVGDATCQKLAIRQ